MFFRNSTGPLHSGSTVIGTSATGVVIAVKRIGTTPGTATASGLTGNRHGFRTSGSATEFYDDFQVV